MSMSDIEPTPDEWEQQQAVDPDAEEEEPPRPDPERIVPYPDPAWDEPSP